MIKLHIRVDGVDEGSRTHHWLRKNILAQAGLSEADYVTNCSTIGDKLPLLLMCKSVKEDKLMPEVLGIKSIADYHGHIQWKRGRLVGVTFHPSAAVSNPNLLPLVVREITNLLRAAEKPSLLERPNVSKGYYLPQPKEGFVCDLEWNVKTNQTTVVGLAGDSSSAHSSYNVSDGLNTVREAIKAGKQIMGHNIVESDLPRILQPGSPNYSEISLASDRVFDTKIVAHIIHGHMAESGLYDLGSMSRFYSPVSEWKLDKTDLLGYNGLDCAYNYRLADALKADLTLTGQWHLVEKQQRLARMCYEMCAIGVRIDKEGLWKYAKQREVDKQADKDSFGFNPNSGGQIKDWGKGVLGITFRDSKFETLSKYRGRDAKLDRLIDYRDDNKSLSTWFPLEYSGKGKKKVLSQVGDVIHPHHNTTGTAVARFSCADPNIQNLPPHLRVYLIPPPDHDIWVFDAGQLENRTVAWHADDFDALKAWESADPYTVTASVMFGKTHAEIKQDASYWKQQNAKKNSLREKGKTTELASIYGETHFNLSNRLFGNQKKDSIIEAKRLQELYFARRPKVKAWQNEMERRFSRGEVMFRNPFGRVRYVYAQNAHEFKKRACHYMGCSSGADYINERALQVIDELRVLPFAIVHDDFSCWLPKGDAGIKIARQIVDIYQAPITQMPLPDGGGLRIPIEPKCGPNYRDVREVTL